MVRCLPGTILAPFNLLANTDNYKFNVLLTPGLTSQENSSQISSIISNTENRGDNIFVLDLVPFDIDSTAVVTSAASNKTHHMLQRTGHGFNFVTQIQAL